MGDVSIWMKLVVLIGCFLRGIWENEKEAVMFLFCFVGHCNGFSNSQTLNILDILLYSCIYSHMHPLSYSNVHAHIYDL